MSTPRTDAEITFTGAYTCGELSVDECNARTATLTAERNQLRARAEAAEAAETVALVKWNGALERAVKAEADLAALEQCHDDNCRAVVWLDAELEKVRPRFNRAVKVEEQFRILKETFDHVTNMYDAAMTRAERAEADLASAKADFLALEQYHNTNCHSVVKFADDFVAEQARLDWLMAGGVCMVQHSGGYHISRLHAQVSRADIDAAMKEDAK